jgi:hypothetical protein
VRPVQVIVTTMIQRVERVERRREMGVSSSEKDLSVKIGVAVGGGETEYLSNSKGH